MAFVHTCLLGLIEVSDPVGADLICAMGAHRDIDLSNLQIMVEILGHDGSLE